MLPTDAFQSTALHSALLLKPQTSCHANMHHPQCELYLGSFFLDPEDVRKSQSECNLKLH